jgi:hypothetical protein
MTNQTLLRLLPVAALVGALAACDRGEPAQAPASATPPAATPAPAATAPASTSASEPTAGGTVDASGLTFSMPAGWTRKAPGTMRVAELGAPAPEGSTEEAAEIAFFSFGPQGAGDAAANVARWASLVHDDAGQPAPHTTGTVNVGDLTLTLVESTGAYQSGSPAGPKTPKPGFTLFGAIIEGGPQGPLYIRMTGPTAVINEHRERWHALIRSARAGAP